MLKTGRYSLKCLGAAKQHSNYDVIALNEKGGFGPVSECPNSDLIIRPIDGFGNQEILRYLLVTEKPDAVLIFTDPRFFMYLFEMEDEIHQQCPLIFYTVWDNLPWPEFNRPIYDGVDLLNTHSYLTYEMLMEHYPEKTNWLPHALPQNLFFPMSKEKALETRRELFGPDKDDWFIGLWINRNAKRKRPGDVLWAWQMFLEQLEKKHGHRKAMLTMHTDPKDLEGPNLLEIVNMLKIQDCVTFSTQHVEFDRMNMLHAASDFCCNFSFAEGFGLSTLESMQTGHPIIAVKTGGQTRQVINSKTGEVNGIALDPVVKSLVGSQSVCYLYEDYAAVEDLSKAFLDMYELGSKKRKEIGAKAREYVLSEFNLDNVIKKWDETMGDCIKNWKKKKTSSWQLISI